MNIRSAILAAADHIERYPGEFDFSSVVIPGLGCGTPGCALGWISAFAGYKERRYGFCEIAGKELGLAPEPLPDMNPEHGSSTYTFYNRMDALDGGRAVSTWRDFPDVCAATLRKYADKYHASEKEEKKGIPAEVRAIFDKVYTAMDLTA
jgi:hypothetical protein